MEAQWQSLFTMRNLMSFPMITIQVSLILYIAIVTVVYLPPISEYYVIHLVILFTLWGLTIASLIQVFRCDPGYVTVEIIEQIKLGLGYLATQTQTNTEPHHTEESVDENDHNHTTGSEDTVMDLNRALIRTVRKRARMNAPNQIMNSMQKSQSIELDSFDSNTLGNHTPASGRESSPPKKSNRVELPALCCFRMCDLCSAIQPPRAYHCDICEKCVLRGEHHCFWVGNCIGLRNQKHFILYLLYLTLSSGYLVLLQTNFLTIKAFQLIEMLFYSINFAVVTFLCFGLWFCSIVMFFISLKLIIFNQTTMEIGQAQAYGDKHGFRHSYFSLGSAWNNIRDMLGFDKWWQCLIK